MRERVWRVWLAVIAVVACVTSMTVIATPPMAQATPETMASAEQNVVTPKGPEFRDNNTVYIPSDQGVRYHIYTYGSGKKMEIFYPDSGLAYAKPGSYGAEQGADLSGLVVVTAISAGSATVLDGTTAWAHLYTQVTDQITYNEEQTTITFPQLDGVEFLVNGNAVNGNTFQATSGTTVTITGKTTVEEAPDVEISGLDLTHKFPTVVTPKGPQFNDDAGTVYIPSDQGVRYYIVIDGKTIAKDGLAYSKPGTYTADDGITAGKLITVDAKSAGSSTVLVGTTHWEATFPLKPTAPTFDDGNTSVTIPEVEGVAYYIDEGKNPTQSGSHSGTQGKKMTVVAKNAETDEVLATWTHIFPKKVTPKGPDFDDNTSSITIPSDQGVRYYIVIDGKMITKEGLDFSKPGTYTAADGIVTGKLIIVDAKSAGSATVLTGTAHWEYTLPIRPSSSLRNGDEFNDDSPLVNKNWKVLSQKVSSLKEGVNLLYTTDSVEVKDGKLNIITERHCLAPGEEPTADNVHPEPCESGKRTVYTSGRIESAFDYLAPFEMEVRAYMDPTNAQGMHFAAWIRNNQKYCGKDVSSSPVAELDTMEVYGNDESTTHTSHVSCVAGPNGEDWTTRDYHSQPRKIAGQWNTYKMVYDGYSIEYFFNGEAVPIDGTNHSKTTAQSLGISQSKFRNTLNNYPWQIILNNSVFNDGSWRPAPDANNRFDRRVDQIDYVRIKSIPDVYPHGAIGHYWTNHGGASGWLGAPIDAELSVSGGASQSFQGGTVFWCARTNTTYAVKGGVRDKYEALKWEQGLLGFPTSDERQLRGGVSQSFENGQIHWSASMGAHFTRGAIQEYWSRAGWENGWLGYPTGDELSVSGGASQSFQGGTVFWCARTNTTYAVKGGVRDKYEALKWEQGLLGFPTSDERQLRGGVSQSFENGQIHWSPLTEGHATRGAIQEHWASAGWENGWLGYPSSEEIDDPLKPGEVFQNFQGGQIHWRSWSNSTYTTRW